MWLLQWFHKVWWEWNWWKIFVLRCCFFNLSPLLPNPAKVKIRVISRSTCLCLLVILPPWPSPGWIFSTNKKPASSLLFHSFDSNLTRTKEFRLWRRKTYKRSQAKRVYQTGCVPELDKGRAGQQATSAKSFDFNPTEIRPTISSVFQIAAENCSQLQRNQPRRRGFPSYHMTQALSKAGVPTLFLAAKMTKST